MHFHKSEKFASMKHRSIALYFIWWQFGCQNKSMDSWVPWTLDVFQGTFSPQALFSLHYSYWQILDLISEGKTGKVLPERAGTVPVVFWTSRLVTSTCFSAYLPGNYVSLFLSHSILSPACLILKFLIGFSLYQYIWIITPYFWTATLSLQVQPKKLASHMKTCSTVFLMRSK